MLDACPLAFSLLPFKICYASRQIGWTRLDAQILEGFCFYGQKTCWQKGGEKPTIPENIIKTAKWVLQNYGCHEPIIFVQGTRHNGFTQMPDGKDLAERVQNMHTTGMLTALRGDIGEVSLVVYVSEGWMGTPRRPFVMPSQDPNRKEVLIITALDPATGKQTAKVFAVIRDEQCDEVLELRPVPTPEETEVESPLLPAFLAGFRRMKR
jgi:hypothetical protein